ncbi:MAG: ketoacid-CoA transferase [Candidatus Thorarchaeota archaeon]|nr:MAG: ketoacid-CoA transferase [Candidatus Thorarchaeota archaeon]
MSQDYSSTEMMAIACSRRIKNDDIVFCGTGLPMLAAVTAKMTSAPDCVIFFETGAMDPALLEIPLTVADPRVMYKSSHNGSLADAFSYMQNQQSGSKVLGILSGAQIDIFGNLNSTQIGEYENLSVRLPGSGGACDVATSVGRTFIFMRHETRRFVKQLDYLTSPGWLSGGTSREENGLPGGGPEYVITSLGVLAFEEKTKRMYLTSFYKFTSPGEIQKNTGFELDTSLAKPEKPPTSDELKILRNRVDPLRLILR